jgi:DNA-directed RNA polymerase subunit F
MKSVQDVAAQAEALRTRALEIMRQFRDHADNPEKIIELSDELVALVEHYEAHAATLIRIQEMAEVLVTQSCSGPH